MKKKIDKQKLDKLRQTPGAGVVIFYVDNSEVNSCWWLALERLVTPEHGVTILYPAKRRCMILKGRKTIFHGTPNQALEFTYGNTAVRKPLSQYYMDKLYEQDPVSVFYSDRGSKYREITDELIVATDDTPI